MIGFLNVLKTPGITSSTVVSVVRHILGMKKVGHAGTLDPAACGVLPIMIGKATKLFDYLDNQGKQYISEFKFGIETDTFDMQGKIVDTDDCDISIDKINKVLHLFIGKIQQIPPKVSAISINGQKAYKMQRKGIDFDIPAREVEIYNIEVIRKTNDNEFLFKVDCSKGTYIRSLCRDIAKELKTIGYITYLNRTRSDYFDIKDAYSLESLRETDISKILIPEDRPIDHLPRYDFDDNSKRLLSNGVKIESNIDDDRIFRLYNRDKFFGIAKNIKRDNIRLVKIIKSFND